MKKRSTILFLVAVAGLLAGSPAWGLVRVFDRDLMPGTIDGVQRKCLDCHRTRNLNTNEGVYSSNAFCYECHGREACRRLVDGKPVSLLVTPRSFEKTRHEFVGCVRCHADVSWSPHLSTAGVQCLGCHKPHGEAAAHDPHVKVRCEACHTDSAFVERDQGTGEVRLARVDKKGTVVDFTKHRMTRVDNEEFCKRCHAPGNNVGASSMILPAKSVLCIMCHDAPLRVGHWLFGASLLVGFLGFVGTGVFWLRGRVGEEGTSTHRKLASGAQSVWEGLFSRRFFSVLGTLFYDVLLQRKILKESVRRWSIHSLIFLGFMGRLFLSLLVHLIHWIAPESPTGLLLLDKNYWPVAFTYDFLGFLILVGILWAAVLRYAVRPPHVLSEEQDNVSLVFIGLIVLSGFSLEGARILMTGVPASTAAYAFGGFAVSKLFGLMGADWEGTFGYLWYAHAILWALFIAYLPFGKFRHIVTTPLSLILRGSGGK